MNVDDVQVPEKTGDVVLRPSLGARVFWVISTLLLTAFFVYGVTWTDWKWYIEAGLVLFCAAGFIAFLVRLLYPRSCALDLTAEGLMTRTPVWGTPMMFVRWVDIFGFTYCEADGWRGAQTERRVAWQASQSTLYKRRRPWTGGVNPEGVAFDGALPDRYLGFEPMTALLKERVDEAKLCDATAEDVLPQRLGA